MNDNIDILNDEFGNEFQFEFLDLVEYNGEEYVVLLPADDEDGEVVILKVEAIDDDNDSYASVEDEDILMAVFQLFKDKFKYEFVLRNKALVCQT